MPGTQSVKNLNSVMSGSKLHKLEFKKEVKISTKKDSKK
jgi:hypothetical protein